MCDNFVPDKQNADMFRVCAGDRYISKKLLRLALFLFYISSVNCYFNLLASKAILERPATESNLSHGNITTRSWHSESDNLFKSAAKGMCFIYYGCIVSRMVTSSGS